ncbi:tRNA modification GTPase [Fistulifera solaris]|uniref:tRNA modification GTPase n=1 Tax=Fistulifera solaris TaxID=1519565 RepID=A0A1Z5KLN2_FISSO|nr:tRNA modification GTPase [Fistulifera solaris]|eukprot:GAX26972.1 tRNA modification GTPase [Fistulifera solaris]
MTVFLLSCLFRRQVYAFQLTRRQTSFVPRARILSRLYSTINNDLMEDDTIFALSSGGSAAQATAVAIIRISGTQAPAILQSLTTPGTLLPKPRYAALRKLYYKEQPLDQALVLYFPGPNSFTGEDVVELHCHGSRAVVQGVLEAISDSSKLARYAEAGEFTQRAWRNGKMDVLQVEALADLLTADTNTQRLQALQQLEGKLSETYQSWREKLIAGLAHAEAVIDFGDDERFGDDDFEDPEVGRRLQQESVWGGVIDQMQSLCKEMEVQLSDQRRGELVREGVRISILGPPNAGKSSLFNVLAQRDAAIVSDTPGTTRDVLELTLNLGGVKCILQDTAGVRTETEDTIEREGMKRAFAAASQADLIVSMVDSTDYQAGINILNRVLTECIRSEEGDDDNDDDIGVSGVGSLTPESVLLVRNKYDLLSDGRTSLDPATTNDLAGIFDISCVTQEGIDHFLESLTSLVLSRVSGTEPSSSSRYPGEGALITRARHRQHARSAVDALNRFDFLSRQGTIAVDMAAEELRLAASELGRITGAVDVEDVLDKLFTDFCIGK